MQALYTKLQKTKGNFQLNIDVHFQTGITGIFGPSGAGKSTFLHLLAGLEKPDEGKIVAGESVLWDTEKNIDIPARLRRIGYVFQEGRLFPHMNIKNNLTFAQAYHKQEKATIDFEEVVDLLEIRSLLQKFPKNLSGGEKQRVAIGRALLSKPRILLMDEPFSSLDFALRKQIIPYLIKINRRLSIPILVVSHDLPDLLSLTQDLFLLRKGKVVGKGKYLDLITKDASLDIMRGAGLLNVIPFQVREHDMENGISVLSNQNAVHEIKVQRELMCEICQIGDEMNVSLRPEDIALTLQPIENISIRNQIPGIITKIIQKECKTYCIVDVGFQLIVSITQASQKKMNLQEGKEVYCLFKSMALEVVG